MNLTTGAAAQYCIRDSCKYGQMPQAAPAAGWAWYTKQETCSPQEHFSSAVEARANGISFRMGAVWQYLT